VTKAAFIDRDGVLNEMVYDADHGLMDSPRRPEQVQLCAHAADFLRGLKEEGYLRIVVTNQPGLAKGTLTESELKAVNGRIVELLVAEGAEWDDLYYCPHHPDGGSTPVDTYVEACNCRKPQPGMLLEAAKAHGVDLGSSWMIGDGLTDVQAGRAAGCRTMLVARLKVMHLERFFDMKEAEPEFVAPDLAKALDIVRKEGRE
jgi:D-glycero-D-manno-heptose 1,7-bisphosphate phosphatase